MKLQYLPANCAWVFTFGDSLVRLDGFPMFFRRRVEALAAASAVGVKL